MSSVNRATIYLIPAPLDTEVIDTLPAIVPNAIKQCQVFFAEELRTARRYFKKLWPEMVIDHYEWVAIGKAEEEVTGLFKKYCNQGKIIGIVSEAGCPCIADPGELLVMIAHEMQAIVKPVSGPNAMLLALMASGLNGESFAFNGYLPVDAVQRKAGIQKLQAFVQQNGQTQAFMETPYRNDALLQTLLQTLEDNMMLTIAADITSPEEYIVTKTVDAWRKGTSPALHKRPVIFLIGRR